MADGDVTDAGPYTFPLDGTAKSEIKALRNSVNDRWMFTITADQQLFVINIEES